MSGNHFATLAQITAFEPGDRISLGHDDGTTLEATVTIPHGSAHPKIIVPGFGTRCIHELVGLGWHHLHHAREVEA